LTKTINAALTEKFVVEYPFRYALLYLVVQYFSWLLNERIAFGFTFVRFEKVLEKRFKNIALVGNPNCGKSSLFNALTGLNQKVGNFPGVTVDKKTGRFAISDSLVANLIDLPGTYSLYPKSDDEIVTFDVLFDDDEAVKIDGIIGTSLIKLCNWKLDPTNQMISVSKTAFKKEINT
jgi:hypothetical protein